MISSKNYRNNKASLDCRRFGRALLALAALGLALAPGCSGSTSKADARVFGDYGQQLDSGPLPFFREAGCGDASGPCGDASSATPDTMPPDMMQPDQCIPPTSCAITFTLTKGSESSAAVAGDFNNWSETADPMTLSGSAWELKKTFADGTRVLYKFVLDGSTWIPDPNNPNRTNDQYKNSYLDVVCPNPCGQ